MPTFTTSDGVRLFYDERGSGRPLILIGGWTMSTEWWRRQLSRLSESLRVIAVDMRSYGRSEKVDHGHRVARYAADVHELVVGLALERAVLCGWSMGASTIWSYVDLYGTDRLAAVVLVDQTPCCLTGDDWTTGLGTEFRHADIEARCTEFERGPREWARAFIPAMFVEPPSEEDQAWMLSEMMKMPPAHASRVLRDHLNHDWRDVLPRVDVPALVVTGARSALFPPESGRLQAEAMPYARHVVFEHSNHLPFYEEAERFNDAVTSFVAALDDAA